MRYDQSVRALQDRCSTAALLGEPVLATIDMRAIPHWMPWQERLGWVDAADHEHPSPRHVPLLVRRSRSASSPASRPDPRTAKKFAHDDGICLYILEYDNGLRASSWDDVWAGPGARRGRQRTSASAGGSKGPKAWPAARSAGRAIPSARPARSTTRPSTTPGDWHRPRWNEVWFPDAFVGPMAELLLAIEDGARARHQRRDNLKTMALVRCRVATSAREHRVPLNSYGS